MRNNLFRTMALLAALALTLTLSVSAETTTKELNLYSPAKVGSTQLEVGTYKMKIDGNKVTIHQGKKMLAETNGEFVERDAKSDANAVVVNGQGQITEIRFAGSKRVLVLNN